MKKILCVLMLIMSIAIVGCSKSEQSKESKDQTQTTKQDNKVNNLEGQEDTGEGSIYLVNESGDTTIGNPLKVLVDKDTQLLQIGLNSEGVDGSKMSYIYINGELVDKQQLSDSQISIDLESKHLKVGTYIVQVAQYDNNKEDENIILLKSNAYEVVN